MWKYGNHLIVYATAFLGAYAFVRGISILVGKYPNEVTLYGQIATGTFSGLESEFYFYLAGIIVLGGIGCLVQFKRGYDQQSEEDGDFKKL